jgi:hypothetical protein
MRRLQDVPDDRRRIHAAANHGDEVGHKQQPHPTVLEHLAHSSL